MIERRWRLPCLFLLLGFFAGTVGAQMPMVHPMADSVESRELTWTLGAQAIGLATRASPAHAGQSLTEGYLTQTMVMGTLSARGGLLSAQGMLDFEGLTLERGELDAGIYGEGYVDRRHPHTYLHEVVATASGALAATHFSLTVGKGFVPFGTDDPMVRPFEKYPVNHHISQIVERLLATVAVRRGPFAVEAARFNGDEPESPSDLPNSNRLFDSWATRTTVQPISRLELQASVARVKSPELASGGGLDQRKLSASARLEYAPARESGHDLDPIIALETRRRISYYGLLEWGKGSEYDGAVKAFSFSTALAEAEVSRAGLAFGVRIERTDRPEEQRLANPFRTQRPATDLSILGRTRWDIATVRLSAYGEESRVNTFVPFVEIARQHANSLTQPAIFEPDAFYGSDTMWSVSAGVGLRLGMLHRRTGGYGAAGKEMTGMSMRGTVPGRAVSQPGKR